MNVIKLIEARRAELQRLFDIETEKENAAKTEKIRLQGEYRALDYILNETNKKKAGKDGRV